jgi:hypothetical protein
VVGRTSVSTAVDIPGASMPPANRNDRVSGSEGEVGVAR